MSRSAGRTTLDEEAPPGMASRERLSGWGNHPRLDCDVMRPPSRDDVPYATRHAAPMIPRGLGRSYGDAALNSVGNGGVVDLTALDGVLDWNEETGVLRAEAGLSLQAIVTTFGPRGWFLPVTPGTWFVTLGGAVAADVHGKNHHEAGSFGRHVLAFTLLDGRGRLLRCTRHRNKEAYFATLGGMGLTGVILDVTLALQPIGSAWMSSTTTKAPNLDAALDAFHATDQDFQCSMAWIDCAAKGDQLGRSVLMQADHAAPDDVPATDEPLALRPPRRPGIPLNAPGWGLNRWTVRGFNAAYYGRAKEGKHVVPMLPYFYPLDAIGKWNRLYGRRGFIQYQCVLPPDAEREGLRAILAKVARAGRSSPLAVLKRFGNGEPQAPLSFPMPGATLALDMPAKPGVHAFCKDLDAIVLAHGGRNYLAKDACMDVDTVAAMYPQLDRWRKIRDRLDPEGQFTSELGRRTGLVDAKTKRGNVGLPWWLQREVT